MRIKNARSMVVDVSKHGSARPSSIRIPNESTRETESDRRLERAAESQHALQSATENQRPSQRATQSPGLAGQTMSSNPPASVISDSFIEEIQRGAAWRASLEAAATSAAREKRERQERETDSLIALEGIRAQLEELGNVIAEHDELLKRHDEELLTLRSGAPGRPSAMHLVQIEFDRRVALGQLDESVTALSGALEAWLRSSYPDAAPLKAKSIRNNLGASYREAKARLRSGPAGQGRQRRH